MQGVFRIVDLLSQAGAAQRVLRGKPAAEKLVWLAARGHLEAHPQIDGFCQSYRFESTIGICCNFFLDPDGELVFLGDHHTFTVAADE